MPDNNQNDTKTGATAVDEQQSESIGSTIRFPAELWKRAKIMAVMRDCSASDLVIEALRRHIVALEGEE